MGTEDIQAQIDALQKQLADATAEEQAAKQADPHYAVETAIHEVAHVAATGAPLAAKVVHAALKELYNFVIQRLEGK